jgi:hypothetical protein
MPGLREVEFDANLCAECEVREPVGPCAACEAMICGECGVMSKDPVGTKVICTSCARLVAHVGDRRVKRRTATGKAVAIGLLVAFAVTALTLLLR